MYIYIKRSIHFEPPTKAACSGWEGEGHPCHHVKQQTAGDEHGTITLQTKRAHTLYFFDLYYNV